MEILHSPWSNALFSLLINLPFGYWRAGCRKLSFPWFAAIHIPIILTITLRLLVGVAFRFSTLPVYVLAFAGGQILGARLRNLHRPNP